MFDIGFTELLLIGLVALLVLGPERLPVAARMAGLWIGRIKRSFNSIKEEVEREIGADEIRRQLHNEDILAKERKMLEETASMAKDSLQQGVKAIEENVQSVKSSTQETVEAVTSATSVQTPAQLKQPEGIGQNKNE